MNLLNGFDSVWAPVSWCFTIDSHRSCRLTEVVNTGVDTNLVHNSDAGLLALLIKLHHSRANIASCDNVLLSADSGLDDHGVESWLNCQPGPKVRNKLTGSGHTVRDQGNDKVVLGELGIEGLLIVDIEGDGSGILDTSGEGLGGLKGTAG